MLEAMLLATIVVAVAFDFTNGFHDTANAIATSVSTRALTPTQAVILSAVLNLVGAVITVVFFGGKVSNTIAKLVSIKPELSLLIAALVGAIVWNLLTWYRGIPSSSTHALVGGLIGAAWAASGSWHGLKWTAIGQVVVYLVVSPPVGFLAAAVFMLLLYLVLRRARPSILNRIFRQLQILTAAFVSYSHGSNDAQKTMAIITLALVASGHLAKFKVPLWVVVLSAVAIGFGTYAGGWRIIRTLGWRIYKLEPATGLGAQLMSATTIQVATQLGFPVSTTHVVTGAVMGAGAPRNLFGIRWAVGASIVLAWILTIPAAAILAWVAYAILHTAGLH